MDVIGSDFNKINSCIRMLHALSDSSNRFFLFPVYNYTGALVTMVGRLKALGDYGPLNTQIRETLDC